MAALVIHTAALELTEEVEEAVFIGGVAAKLLHGEWQMQTAVGVMQFTLTANLSPERRIPQTIKED